MEQVLINLAFLTFTIVISHLGTDVLAAQRIAMNAMSLSFLPGFGFAIAATALVGQSIGARRPDEGAAVARRRLPASASRQAHARFDPPLIPFDETK